MNVCELMKITIKANIKGARKQRTDNLENELNIQPQNYREFKGFALSLTPVLLHRMFDRYIVGAKELVSSKINFFHFRDTHTSKLLIKAVSCLRAIAQLDLTIDI